MAATQRQIRHVTQRLENLDEERRELHGLLDTCIDKILTAGRSWIDSQGSSNYSFQDISVVVERALTFLVDKSDEIPAGLTAEGTIEIPSATSQQSSSASSSSPAVVSQPSSTGQTSDEVVATILNRLDNMENDHVKIKDFDKRVEQIERERKEVDIEKVKEVEGRIGRLEKNLKDLPTFAGRLERVEERLQTLPKLSEALTKVQEERQNDTKVIQDIKTKISTFSSELHASKKEPAGFTAEITRDVTLEVNTTITGFTRILTNIGNHYNPSTGEFTAPVDGLYLSSLTHEHDGGDGMRILHVICKRNNAGSGGEKEERVCWTRTDVDKTSCTGVNVIYMNAGDRLFVRVVQGERYLWASFSCCLIG